MEYRNVFKYLKQRVYNLSISFKCNPNTVLSYHNANEQQITNDKEQIARQRRQSTGRADDSFRNIVAKVPNFSVDLRNSSCSVNHTGVSTYRYM